MWKKRQKRGDKFIGRMYTVSIKDPERFYLRMLLQHETGVTSFQDLKTVVVNAETKLCNSYQETAREKGYLLDDTMWQKTLDDAKSYSMPAKARQLFAYICAFCSPSDTLSLWTENKEDMTEDICHRLHSQNAPCVNCESYSLKDIQSALRNVGFTLVSFRLPAVSPGLPKMDYLPVNFEEEKKTAERMISSLNSMQLMAFHKVINATEEAQSRARCYFLDGPGGSGKTYLYETFIRYFRSRKQIVMAAATTGVAANLLIDGRTCHSMIKLPVPICEASISTMKMESESADDTRRAELVILDECTTASCHLLNTIDKLFKEVMQTDIPFGGKVMLIGGDFRQCLAIVPHAMRSTIVQSSLKYSDSWKHFEKLRLVENMRCIDPSFNEWLLQLGIGSLSRSLISEPDMIEIPSEFICNELLITEIFGETIALNDISSFAKKVILCPKNVDVDRINCQVTELLPEQNRIYLSTDKVETDDENERINFPLEYLNTIISAGLPQHELILKVGTIVMLLRNLNTILGLCNGTRLVVKSMKDNVIEEENLTTSHLGEIVLIPRIDLTSSDLELPFTLKRRQFPVKLLLP